MRRSGKEEEGKREDENPLDVYEVDSLLVAYSAVEDDYFVARVLQRGPA